MWALLPQLELPKPQGLLPSLYLSSGSSLASLRALLDPTLWLPVESCPVPMSTLLCLPPINTPKAITLHKLIFSPSWSIPLHVSCMVCVSCQGKTCRFGARSIAAWPFPQLLGPIRVPRADLSIATLKLSLGLWRRSPCSPPGHGQHESLLVNFTEQLGFLTPVAPPCQPDQLSPESDVL